MNDEGIMNNEWEISEHLMAIWKKHQKPEVKNKRDSDRWMITLCRG